MMELSNGERIRILRRRNNLTQDQVAAKYGVQKATVYMWESDTAAFPGIVNPIKNLTSAEECYILRRRLGMLIREVKESLNISHVTVIKWEKNGPPDGRYKEFLLTKTAEKEARELS